MHLTFAVKYFQTLHSIAVSTNMPFLHKALDNFLDINSTLIKRRINLIEM